MHPAAAAMQTALESFEVSCYTNARLCHGFKWLNLYGQGLEDSINFSCDLGLEPVRQHNSGGAIGFQYPTSSTSLRERSASVILCFLRFYQPSECSDRNGKGAGIFGFGLQAHKPKTGTFESREAITGLHNFKNHRHVLTPLIRAKRRDKNRKHPRSEEQDASHSAPQQNLASPRRSGRRVWSSVERGAWSLEWGGSRSEERGAETSATLYDAMWAISMDGNRVKSPGLATPAEKHIDVGKTTLQKGRRFTSPGEVSLADAEELERKEEEARLKEARQEEERMKFEEASTGRARSNTDESNFATSISSVERP
ncbi:hypothetical protein SELMODRAFT_405754 [Selaginella moellendorffii]|uniref:Uncharacterized protein n=1 Tax=Selaginella moellendorffii TaxID=88036 RepID=D8QZL6_SELML|nr:hypothetical protein SELMODRAFT_405754 [Selaginella moellendorffii]